MRGTDDMGTSGEDVVHLKSTEAPIGDTPLVMIAHAPSRPFRRAVSAAFGDAPRFATLAELRDRPLGKLFRHLRSQAPSGVYVGAETDGDRAFFPLLQTLSLLAGVRLIGVIGPSADIRPPSWRQRLGACGRFLAAVVGGLLAVARSRATIFRLNRCARSTVTATSSGPIVFLMPGLAWDRAAGGALAHATGVANGFARAGRAVEVLTAGDGATFDPAVSVARVPALECRIVPGEVDLYRHDDVFVKNVVERIGGRAGGFVYTRLTPGSTAGVRVARALGLPLVLEYNGSEAWIARTWGNPLRFEELTDAAEAVCLRHAHLVVTVSEALRDEVVARGVDAGRVIWHPNGVDPEIFNAKRFGAGEVAALRSDCGLPEGEVVLTFVGTFGRWHGADVLARAIRHLVETDSRFLEQNRVRFCFVGDGVMRAAAETTLESPPCSKFVTFIGLVPASDVPLHMALSDVLVSPHVANTDGSRFFGSPTKLFEYLAMGRPVIASDLEQIGDVLAGNPRIGDLGGGQELPSDGSYAILVEPGNVADLAAAIRWAVDNRAWRRRAGDAARRRALSRFTWEQHVNAILRALDEADSALNPNNLLEK